MVVPSQLGSRNLLGAEKELFFCFACFVLALSGILAYIFYICIIFFYIHRIHILHKRCVWTFDLPGSHNPSFGPLTQPVLVVLVLQISVLVLVMLEILRP